MKPQETKLFRCRMCERLLKKPVTEMKVYDGDPSCCRKCNESAELAI